MKTFALALGLALSTAAAAAPAPAGPAGIWRNDADSVRIRVAPCGAGLCGTVIAADAKAQADAARGGTTRLIGTQLFRDFQRGPDGVWAGQVFVPDLNVAVSGTLDQPSRNQLVAAGCLFGGFGCREQVWTRVPAR